MDRAPTVHDFSAKTIDGKDRRLAEYAGKVLLVVNVASECGFTPQYEGLERLHEELAPRGFAVLAFPSNDFGGQEPGEAPQIEAFARDTYHATFPLFAKVVVKGDGAAPLFRFLAEREGPPRWNFTKYLVGKDGAVKAKYASTTKPDDSDLRRAIEAELARP